jgi:hypothetical protein
MREHILRDHAYRHRNAGMRMGEAQMFKNAGGNYRVADPGGGNEEDSHRGKKVSSSFSEEKEPKRLLFV